ncbi:MAG: 6,7-dimethyl-8-ribityllumazine synthase [Bacteroidetes bacterium]|jgi:6,7-dimethyl-8-ribityllumazine synthase|nr:6,7-dimethyl-8-ribityllumazine synthase [Bacteroidota bacterium]
MATRDLSSYNTSDVPSAVDYTFGIVVADWNQEITGELLKGAIKALRDNGAQKDNIVVRHVPGTFELTSGTQLMMEYVELDVIICLGCVIRGETPHFDYICQGVTYGITQVSVQYNKPVIFGVLTTENMEQAKERSGGKHGNKGVEAGLTAIRMAYYQDEMESFEDEDDYYSMN